jgi:hypothetical protein
MKVIDDDLIQDFLSLKIGVEEIEAFLIDYTREKTGLQLACLGEPLDPNLRPDGSPYSQA